MMGRQPWPTAAIANCLTPVSFSGITKIQSRDYQQTGRFPIIDQGQESIAGWTDDEKAVISSPLPLLVFGDHTRVFKFVDVPFARGADGTQVLKPKADIDPLFFFYACRAIDLPSRGYNRHFSVLKEKYIPLPEQDEQESIGLILLQVEGVFQQQSLLIASTQALKRAAMRELFTKGLRGKPQKETEIGQLPESWEVKELKDICTMRSGGTPPKSMSELWAGDFPWVSGKDLKANRLDDSIDHITHDAAFNYSEIAPADSVLVLVRGMGLAKGFALSLIARPMAFNQDLKALTPDPPLTGDFLMHVLTFAGQRMLRNVADAAHGTKRLSQEDLNTFLLPIPSSGEQSDIVTILDAIDRKIDLHRKKRALLEELFKSLLHKLMTGEIRVSDLDLSALEAQPA
jgi:type I restriction enzyme S subunit